MKTSWAVAAAAAATLLTGWAMRHVGPPQRPSNRVIHPRRAEIRTVLQARARAVTGPDRLAEPPVHWRDCLLRH
ncbi:MAG: hypothetical protein NZ700_15280 [Gemmataceae bacterium]|nr:hypothetical protein [Gemmataceae bacterium]MDW8266185.1 hypothetical protein [Gemmataceae bacterium]